MITDVLSLKSKIKKYYILVNFVVVISISVENAPRIQHVSIRKVSRGLADHVLTSVRPDCV
jgi:hypothetical protein